MTHTWDGETTRCQMVVCLTICDLPETKEITIRLYNAYYIRWDLFFNVVSASFKSYPQFRDTLCVTQFCSSGSLARATLYEALITLCLGIEHDSSESPYLDERASYVQMNRLHWIAFQLNFKNRCACQIATGPNRMKYFVVLNSPGFTFSSTFPGFFHYLHDSNFSQLKNLFLTKKTVDYATFV